VTTDARERFAWTAGIVFVVALVAEGAISTGVGLSQNDSAATIAAGLHAHEGRLLAVAALSVVYAVAFVVYLWKLHLLLRGAPERPVPLSTLVLIGLVLFVSLHAVSDIGITGMLGATVAAYSAQHDPGLAYVLYLLTFALDSVGDVFGSFGFLASGLLVLRTGVLPRWLGWVAVLAAPFLVLQAFGLGGVIATFGLVLDLIGFVLLLVFVAASSAVLLRRPRRQTTM
jgi:uncharacterized protein DUF4386